MTYFLMVILKSPKLKSQKIWKIKYRISKNFKDSRVTEILKSHLGYSYFLPIIFSLSSRDSYSRLKIAKNFLQQVLFLLGQFWVIVAFGLPRKGFIECLKIVEIFAVFIFAFTFPIFFSAACISWNFKFVSQSASLPDSTLAFFRDSAFRMQFANFPKWLSFG